MTSTGQQDAARVGEALDLAIGTVRYAVAPATPDADIYHEPGGTAAVATMAIEPPLATASSVY
jgi:hypothetical protein